LFDDLEMLLLQEIKDVKNIELDETPERTGKSKL